jgi:hypothetical protein
VGCAKEDVEEIRYLGPTLASWRTEILEHDNTGASNGPTEGLNLRVKKVKRCGHGCRTFHHYRLRVLLHAGGITWPTRAAPPASEPAFPLHRVAPVQPATACELPPNRRKGGAYEFGFGARVRMRAKRCERACHRQLWPR